MSKKEKLFDQFPPVSTKEWMDRITADLKGADFNKRMVWKTGAGFDVMPFYREEDLDNLHYMETLPGEFPFIRGKKISGNNWKIRQNITVTDYWAANSKALEILMKGIDSLGFVIADPDSITEKNFDILLKDIAPEAVELNFLSNGKAKEIVALFISYLKKRGTDPANITGATEADPLSRLMLNGTLCIPVEQGFDYLSEVVKQTIPVPGFRAIHLNASNFVNAGADIVRELAFGISMGAEYMSQLTERGIKPEIAASKIRFSFATGSDYFPEIAKLRAARLLWSTVLNGFEVRDKEKSNMEIHCVTSEWNKTLFDPYVNILRTQTEAMAAVLGGTDSLTVEPFDTIFRDPDEFSERIARNQQLILREESYFDKVADPSAGSYYIENLTHLIADNAWKLFLEVEKRGGFLESLKNGFIQEEIRKSAEKRNDDISKHKIVFLGTNQYPDQSQKIPANADLRRTFKEVVKGDGLSVEPLKIYRGPELIEKLRLQVENAGRRPAVFLFTIGNPAMRKARAQFSLDFFGCAGYRIIGNPGFKTVEAGVTEALRTKANIVVICSSDDEYAAFVPEIYKLLHDKCLVVVAGNPPCLDELKAKGVEYFISIKSDVIDTLRMFSKKLGITA